MDIRIHPTAEVSPGAELGDGVRIWNHCQVREGARLGRGCILSKDVYIDSGVVIGDHCKIQNGISIYHGVTLEDGVFLGPHMVFTNDLRPRAINPDGSLKGGADWVVSETRIGRGASIGAGAVIEDACQAVGAAHLGKPVGSFGTGMFSLYATKNVMTGEGGMLTTNDDALADKARLLRAHGMRRRYFHEMLGYNYRLSDLHAAIGIEQMKRLDAFTAARQANAAYLNAHLTSVITPATRPGNGHVWHQYTVRLIGRDRDAAVKQLADNGVGTGVFYPVPAHRQDYLHDVAGGVSLPITEQLSREVFSLPVHPTLTPADLEKIVAEVNRL